MSVNDLLAREYALKAKEIGIGQFIYASSVHTLDPLNTTSYAISKRSGEASVINEFGDGTTILNLGAVYGNRYSGKLSFLNRLPQWLTPPVQPLVLAFGPTTNVGLIAKFLDNSAPGGRARHIILTDSKAENSYYQIWRHSLNTIFVAFAVFLLPVMVFAWLVIVVSDGMPGIFKQERVGQHGLVFFCWKLRTMRRGTPNRGTHLVEEKSFLPFGRFLRAINMDEIPQALNIIRGEMTLIGPRPSLSSQEELVKKREVAGVLSLMPGLTGWAQVKGADMSQPDLVATLDEQYLHLQSIFLDLRVIIKTLRLG